MSTFTPVASPPRIIRQLPPNLVNQIAAGEVIERPASVVKELLENSVDAGARRIELTIQGGGMELIRISDDGCGIPADQLPLAVTSHATSKLPDDESLFHVGTLGFRGEALASIASVSQMLIRSRPEGGHGGSQLEVRGGILEPPSPCGCPTGTVLEVRNLFFNTPVRRRFLKTAQTERGHIIEAFTRIALGNPRIHFSLRTQDSELFDLLPTRNWADRIAAFFGSEIADSLIAIDSGDPPISISGYTCDPSVSRGNNRMQYLFLNGRHIRDRALQHALGEAYRGLLMVGRHPVCFLRMEMPAELIDVNVHPAKLEVRFTDSGRVYSRLLQSLRQRFLATDMTQRISAPTPHPMADDTLNASPGISVMHLPPAAVDAQRQSVIQWARSGQETSQHLTPHTENRIPLGGTAPFRPFQDGAANFERVPLKTSQAAPASPPAISPASALELSPASSPLGSPPTQRDPSVCYLGIQVHQRYLVTQDERGMVVIDQHALHERVLYERICKKVLGEGAALECQRLLVPEPVSLSPAERAAALEAKEAFAKIGLEIDDFGGETIVVQSVPSIMPRGEPTEMLRTLLESVMGADRDPNPKDLLNHLLSTLACKAAVKAGDPLSPEEITSLLEQKDLYAETHHCPHGRPTALFFSREELDRMFGRLGARGKK